MKNLGSQNIAKLSAMLLLGLSVAGAPALAAKGGNGNGNGNSGKSETARSENQAGVGNNKPAGVEKTKKIKPTQVAAASRFGKLNGFMHASPRALAKASPNSAIGKVAKVYAGLLDGYLAPVEGQTAPTIDQVAQALAAAANKPLTPEVIAAINARLMTARPDLAAKLTASGKTSEALAAEIAAALAI